MRLKSRLEELRDLAVQLGAEDAKLTEAKNVVVKDWVRWKCRFGCDNYGRSLMCPPFSPTPDETRALLGEYEYALLIRQKAPAADLHKLALELERRAFLHGFYSALGFTAGSCKLCEKCDVEKGLCAKPQLARPSMESCGIGVFSTARNAGYEMEVLISKAQEYHRYGLILIK